MKSFTAFVTLLVTSAVAAPLYIPRQAPADAATIARLAPDLGAVPPLPPTGFGDCQGPVKGADGKPASVPCSCPPTREAFIAALTANVQAGQAVNNTVVKISFPVGDSVQDQLDRITASAITLQNLVGPGKGCPLVATTLGVQAKAIQAGGKSAPAPTSPAPAASSPDTPAPADTSSTALPAADSTASATQSTPTADAPAVSLPVAAPASTGAPTSGDGSAADDVVAQLAPDLGVTGPLPPTGRGDCQGPVKGADGQPISVPCQCPPAKDVYIAALVANVRAGKAIKNPEVSITYPTGDSVADKQARINAAAITLQNLDGPGKGCPLAATTLGAQRKALDEQ